MADKIATRESYGSALVELADQYDFIVMDADLAEATKTVKFKKAHPERFFDCGIAEGNMISTAAGVATTGKTVFASSFAMFAAGRAFEQVRNSVGYPHLNVKIGATHAGITVGEDGATHQCNEDLALMRTIPGCSGEGAKGINCDYIEATGGDITILTNAQNFNDNYRSVAIDTQNLVMTNGNVKLSAYDNAVDATEISLFDGTLHAISKEDTAIDADISQTGGWLIIKEAE